MSFNISSIINSNSGNLNLTFTFTGVETEEPPVDDIVIETPRETKKGEGKNGRVISYAEEVKLHIDNTTKEALTKYEPRKLMGWTGKYWSIIPDTLTVRDAMNINLKAKEQLKAKEDVVKISLEFVAQVPLDKEVYDQLDQLEGCLATISLDLKFANSYLCQLRTGKVRAISKERADKINNYIKKKNIGNGSEIFGLERMFQLAVNEPIPEEKTIKKLSENIWVKLEDGHREQLKKLPTEIKTMTFFTSRFGTFLEKRTQKILLKNAAHIEKLSGKKIFSLTKNSIAKISVLPEQLDEFKSSMEEANTANKHINREILNAFTRLINGKLKKISTELAEKINACFGKSIFDLEALLNQGIKEAEEEAELAVSTKKSERSTRKSKHPLSSGDTSSTSEDEDKQRSKRRRINIRDDRGQISPDEVMAAEDLGIQMEQNEPEFPLAASSSSGQIGCYFQQPLTSPFVHE